MANKKHLKRLKQGVKVWNEWRERNPDLKPDLSGADFSKANLRGVNLSKTNLQGANFGGADLRRADLSYANLSGLENPIEKNIKDYSFWRVFLRDANLKEAILKGANLWGADLSYAKLNKAELSRAYLCGANLNQASFKKAILREADLLTTFAIGTDFSHAEFTGACLENWNINSTTKLEQVICDYVYFRGSDDWLKPNKRYRYQERRPHDHDKNFASGEFTKLFQKALETVDLIFSDGIDWQAFLVSFQKLQVECGSSELAIQAIEKKSGGAFVVRVEVPADANKAEIEKYLKGEYEYQLQAIEEKYTLELNFKNEQLVTYRQHNTDLMEIIKLKASQPIQNIIDVTARAESDMSDTFKIDQSGATNPNVAVAKDNAKQQVNITNLTSEQKQNLAQAAKEIQQLLKQLSQTYPTSTNKEKMAVVAEAADQIESNPKLKARVINALKAAGTEAFKEAIDHPLVNILMATIEGWQETE